VRGENRGSWKALARAISLMVWKRGDTPVIWRCSLEAAPSCGG
jgi:hypothetical protein